MLQEILVDIFFLVHIFDFANKKALDCTGYSFVGSKNIIWNFFCLIFIVSIMCMQGGKITQFGSPSFALENRNVNTGAGGWCSAQCAVTTNIYKNTNTINSNKTLRGRTQFWLRKFNLHTMQFSFRTDILHIPEKYRSKKNLCVLLGL